MRGKVSVGRQPTHLLFKQFRTGPRLEERHALLPTVTAFAVTQLLEEHFQALVDYEFTAQMESTSMISPVV